MTSLSWIELFSVVVLGTSGQIALKAALVRPKSGDASSSGRLLRDPLAWAWVGSYVVTTVLWLHALRSAALSQAFPILGLQYALVPLCAHWFLREGVGSRRWAGILLIFLGVALVGQS